MKKINPFKPNNIAYPGMFQGRYQELASFNNFLHQTKNGHPNHFLIEGERGIGKSSLLVYLSHIAAGNIPNQDGHKFNFLIINISLDPNDNELSIIRKLADELKNELSRDKRIQTSLKDVWDFISKWEILGVRYHQEREAIQPYEALNNFVNTLSRIITSLEEIDGILILIDEADRPETNANLGQFCKFLSEALIKKHCNEVLLGLAGQSNLIRKLRESHESAPRVFNIFNLQPLKSEESRRVIERGIKLAEELNATKIDITEDAIDLLVRLSEGYPHFIQQFSYSAFEEDIDNNIDIRDVYSGAFSSNGAISQLGHIYFKEQYFDSINSNDYRKVLNIMAEHLDSWVSRKELIETTGFEEHTINNALSALKSRGIILLNDSVRGQYRLPTKSFAVWIKAFSYATEEQQAQLFE